MTTAPGITLDLSNWDVATFDAAAFAAAGVRRVVIGTQFPDDTRRMVADCRAAGIEVIGLYVFLYFGGSAGTLDQVNIAIALCHELGIARLWLDCEADGGTNATSSLRNAELAACVDAITAAGLSPGIYTAAWWWVPHHGNVTTWSNLPLWLPAYGVNDGTEAPIEELGALAFGGWTRCAMHQYTSTLMIAGRGRDANYLFEEVPVAQPSQPAEPFAQEINSAIEARFALMRLALGDYSVMLAAVAAIKKAGISL